MNEHTERRLREILKQLEIKIRDEHTITHTGFSHNYNEYSLSLLSGSEDEKFLLNFIKGM